MAIQIFKKCQNYDIILCNRKKISNYTIFSQKNQSDQMIIIIWSEYSSTIFLFWLFIKFLLFCYIIFTLSPSVQSFRFYGRHPTGATYSTALFHKTVPFAQSPTFVHHYLPNPFFQSTLAQS